MGAAAAGDQRHFQGRQKFQAAEIRKLQTLEEKAFNVFFLRFRTKNDYLKFYKIQAPKLAGMDALPLHQAFIYQNNLFIQYRRDLAPGHCPDLSVAPDPQHLPARLPP